MSNWGSVISVASVLPVFILTWSTIFATHALLPFIGYHRMGSYGRLSSNSCLYDHLFRIYLLASVSETLNIILSSKEKNTNADL